MHPARLVTKKLLGALTIAAACSRAGLRRPKGDGSQLTAGAACVSSPEFHLVGGDERPEDLAHIPGTRWLIVSGFQYGAGLK
jgi:hypothetical protein